jgi:guanosine-3',5'-bis(diphosphate) 3'-pyrophosphohydrolase
MNPDPLDLAIEVAARAHRGQRRDGDHPLPYFTHPIEVLVNLRHVGGVSDPRALVAAVLHDTLEETDLTADEIEAQFGSQVRALVVELTRKEPSDDERAGLTKSEIWSLRSEMLLSEIQRMSPAAQTVKLADRLSNVREGKRTKRNGKLERYLAQTRRILEIVSRDVNPGLWDAIQAELPAGA